MKAVPRVTPIDATEPPPLTIDTVQIDAGVVGVVVHGDVDAGNADDLQLHIMEVIDRRRPDSVVIECTGMTFLDAAGITALIRAWEHADRRHTPMRMLNTSRLVTRILTLTGHMDKFHVTPR